MQLSHTIDAVAADGGEVGHAHGACAGFVDERHAANARFVIWESRAYILKEPMINCIDNLHVAWQEPSEERCGPGLQRLGQEGMVGISEGILRDLPCGVPVHEVHVNKQAHELGDCNGRVRVVELHGPACVELFKRPT